MKKLKLNVLTSVLLSTLISTLLLSGCGGSENDNGTDKAPVVEQAPVSARDGFNVVAPDEPGYVDLSSLIESGIAGAKVTSVYLESKQGTGDCGQVLSSSEASGDGTDANVILGQGFNVTIEGAAICEYAYEVESVALAGQTKTRAKAKIMVASSAGGAAILPPISIAMAIDDPVNVTNIQKELDKKGSFPTGYILSEGFSVLGDGDVMVDAASLSVSYTPTAEGVSRVVYALESVPPAAPDIKMGTLDFAISDNLNNAPTAENFAYSEAIEINTSVEISVLGHIDAVDSDELQLIEVKSYTANVASLDPDSLTNKTFTFEAAKAGEHYVSYMVSDKRGGFATGIVEISTFDANQVARWTDIENGILLFSAPQTKFEIDDVGDVYQGFFGDTGYTPTLQITTFTFAGAQAYCDSRGRLPTSAELDAMYVAKSPKTTWLWPAGKDYITQDVKTPGLYSLQTGATSTIGTDLYYVTCVDSGGLTVSADKSTVVANGTDVTTISVSFIRDTGPVVGEILDVTVTGSAIPTETTVTTDDSGHASFSVSSIKAESVNIGVEYTNLSSELVPVGNDVTFIGNIDTAVIGEIVLKTNNAETTSSTGNILQVKVVDENTNSVKGALVNVSITGSASLVQLPDTLKTDINGLVEFNVVDKVGESVTVTASTAGLISGTTSADKQVTFLVPILNYYDSYRFTESNARSFCNGLTHEGFRDWEVASWQKGIIRPWNERTNTLVFWAIDKGVMVISFPDTVSRDDRTSAAVLCARYP